MIVQAPCNSFKLELLLALHDFSSHQFKLALYGSTADLGPGTTAYTPVGEVTGSGYTAGGFDLTARQPYLEVNGTAVAGFSALTTGNLTVQGIEGGLIYNSDSANRAVHVLRFGRIINKSDEPLAVTFPTTQSLRDGPVRIA